MGRKKLILVLLTIIAGAAHASPPALHQFGFSTLKLGCKDGDELCQGPERCGVCHSDRYEQWQASRHAKAWNNDTFQHGFSQETKRFCVHCHAPLAKSWMTMVREGNAVKDHGVSCQVCHVRGGTVMTPEAERAEHPVKVDPQLRTSEFCARCHEFNLIAEKNFRLSATTFPMQQTYSEWRTYQQRGGTETCQTCHMPNSDHRIRGSYDLEYFAKAIRVAWFEEENTFAITNLGVGHNVPTGDVFRQLALLVTREDGSTAEVARLGRTFDVDIDRKTGKISKTLVANTALQPFETRVIPVEGRPIAFKLVYYLNEAGKMQVIHQGKLHP